MADTQYEAEIGDQVLTREIVITVQGGNTQQQPAQQQLGQQQPAQQPVAPKQESPLSFSFEPKCFFPNSEVTIKLNRAANVTVYFGGQVVPKKTSSDGKTLTATTPTSMTVHNQYIELKGDGINLRSDAECTIFGLNFASVDVYSETDLAVTDLYPTNQPIGQIFARITNRGPGGIYRTQVDLVCGAQLEVRPGGVVQSANPINKSNTYLITIQHNETQIIDTGIRSDTDSFFYNVTCLVRPHENSYYGYYQAMDWKYTIGELSWPNNTYSERIP